MKVRNRLFDPALLEQALIGRQPEVTLLLRFVTNPLLCQQAGRTVTVMTLLSSGKTPLITTATTYNKIKYEI